MFALLLLIKMCNFFIVLLSGTSLDRNFRGFLIQARTVGDNSSVGSFDSGILHQQVCSGNVCFNMFVCIKAVAYNHDIISHMHEQR